MIAKTPHFLSLFAGQRCLSSPLFPDSLTHSLTLPLFLIGLNRGRLFSLFRFPLLSSEPEAACMSYLSPPRPTERPLRRLAALELSSPSRPWLAGRPLALPDSPSVVQWSAAP